jgi:2'-5' RNA ligase
MKRVFIGYKCPPFSGLLTAVNELQSKMANCNVKWTSHAYWHITSHFIGNADDREVTVLKDIITEVSRAARIINIEVRGIGFFPSSGRPRVMWAGVKPEDDLAKLYYRTGALLRREGFETDSRPYSPHITLARIKHCNPALTQEVEKDFEGRTFGALTVNEIILYESRLSPSGAKYIPIHTAEMSGH